RFIALVFGFWSGRLFPDGGVPLGDLLAFLVKERVGRPLDLDGLDLVTLRDGAHDVLTLGHFTEDGVLVVQPGRGDVSDEELAAIRAGAGIRHGEDAGLTVLEFRAELILEAVAWATASSAR